MLVPSCQQAREQDKQARKHANTQARLPTLAKMRACILGALGYIVEVMLTADKIKLARSGPAGLALVPKSPDKEGRASKIRKGIDNAFKLSPELDKGLDEADTRVRMAERVAAVFEEGEIQMLAMFFLAGVTLETVASRTMFELGDIQLLVESPRFAETLRSVQAISGQDAALGLLQSNKLSLIQNLLSIANDDKTSAKDRISASTALLEMANNPQNTVNSKELTLQAAKAEMQELQELLADPTLAAMLSEINTKNNT